MRLGVAAGVMAAALGAALGAAHAAPSPVTPGKWQVTTTIETMTMPNVPPEVLKSMVKRPIVTTACVSAADAAAGPRELIAKSNGACRYTRYEVSGGRIDAVMKCTGNGGPQTVAVAGTYGRESYDVRSRMSGGPMQSTGHTVGKRIGPC